MERDEWKSGMMVEDEQILDFISEIDEAIDKAKKTFKDYRPLLNGDRWISDREAAEFLKVSRHTLFIYRQKGLLPYVLLCGKILYRERDLEELLQRNYVPALRLASLLRKRQRVSYLEFPLPFLYYHSLEKSSMWMVIHTFSYIGLPIRRFIINWRNL